MGSWIQMGLSKRGSHIDMMNAAKLWAHFHRWSFYSNFFCPKPYVYNPETQILVTYDNGQSFASKGDFIKTMGLKGFSMWEAAGDPNNILINAIRECRYFGLSCFVSECVVSFQLTERWTVLLALRSHLPRKLNLCRRHRLLAAFLGPLLTYWSARWKHFRYLGS